MKTNFNLVFPKDCMLDIKKMMRDNVVSKVKTFIGLDDSPRMVAKREQCLSSNNNK